MNFTEGIEIKMTKKMGRGLFATEIIPKGALIIGERCLAISEAKIMDSKMTSFIDGTLTPETTIELT